MLRTHPSGDLARRRPLPLERKDTGNGVRLILSPLPQEGSSESEGSLGLTTPRHKQVCWFLDRPAQNLARHAICHRPSEHTLLGHALLRVGRPLCIGEKLLSLVCTLNPLLPLFGTLLMFLFCCELAVRS